MHFWMHPFPLMKSILKKVKWNYLGVFNSGKVQTFWEGHKTFKKDLPILSYVTVIYYFLSYKKVGGHQNILTRSNLNCNNLTNSSDAFTNSFHEYFPQFFLSLESWKRNRNKYSLKKNRIFGIWVWWNYLMNSLII